MTNFWDSYPQGNKDLVRLLTGSGKWLAWSDKEANPDDAGSKRIAGCREQVEDTLNNALHSTHVVVLLGSGASFCAKDAGVSNAPSMWHLWHAVRDDYGQAAFDQIVKDVMGAIPANGEENIEGLLSLCKMSIELLKVQAVNDLHFTGQPKLENLAAFIKAAEKTILEKVGFVKPDTDLTAHTGFIRKFARRSTEKPRVKLFTTNYDLCIETTATRLGVVLVDGLPRPSRSPRRGLSQAARCALYAASSRARPRATDQSPRVSSACRSIA